MTGLLSVVSSLCAVALLVFSFTAAASDINRPTHLTNSGNTAVNNVKAKRYLQEDNESQTDANGNMYDANSGTIVHFGNARKGDCTMNVGGVKSGNQTVVTAKNIVNVCK